jgi:cytochrome P450
MVARGGGDICEDYASHLTIRVFAEWMNVPQSMTAALREVGRAYNLAVQQANGEMVTQTSLQLYQMARDLIAERRRSPLDPKIDPTTALLAARVDGQPFPDDMIVGMIRQVLVVGIIAPTVVVGSIAVHLARDSSLQDTLREQSGLIPEAVEEFLRLYTPYRGFARTATHDVDIEGRSIREGEPIALVYASANRDDDVFKNPDEFVLNRSNIGEHLAFGMGPHVCAGIPLARLELRIAIETLLGATRKFVLDGPIRTTLFPEIGALSVPLKFL